MATLSKYGFIAMCTDFGTPTYLIEIRWKTKTPCYSDASKDVRSLDNTKKTPAVYLNTSLAPASWDWGGRWRITVHSTWWCLHTRTHTHTNPRNMHCARIVKRQIGIECFFCVSIWLLIRSHVLLFFQNIIRDHTWSSWNSDGPRFCVSVVIGAVKTNNRLSRPPIGARGGSINEMSDLLCVMCVGIPGLHALLWEKLP